MGHLALRALKRALDLVFGVLALVVLSPLVALISLAVWMDDGRPVIFTQERVGLNGRRFEILKFRTMQRHGEAAEEVGQVGLDDARLTRTGGFFRRMRLDELPQLVNVVKGDMSLVGPRPTLPGFAVEYDSFQARRLLVRPGMTGWAQVNGNVQIEWEDRILLDVWYVDNWSLVLDAVILLQTLGVLARGERLNPEALERARSHANRARRRS